MFHIPLFAILILAFNRAPLQTRIIGLPRHEMTYQTHISPIQQRQHEHQYSSEFFLSFRSLPPVYLTFLVQFQTQLPTIYTYGRHYLLTPRTTVYATGTTDHG